MAFSITTFNGHNVVQADGELDVSTAPQLRTTLTTAFDSAIIDGAPRLIVDLSAVTFMDSTTLGVLIGTHNRIREAGGALGLVCPDDRIRRVFRITGLDSVFDLHDSLDDAAAALP